MMTIRKDKVLCSSQMVKSLSDPSLKITLMVQAYFTVSIVESLMEDGATIN